MSDDSSQGDLDRVQQIIEHESHYMRPALTLDDAFTLLRQTWMRLSADERQRRLDIWRARYAPHHYHLLLDRLNPEMFHVLYLERDKRDVCTTLYALLTHPNYMRRGEQQ